MKCPKCGYLGFETGDRCRHCGYDFSLAVPLDRADTELPLQQTEGAGAPLADFDLSGLDTSRSPAPTPSFDLDRVIGDPDPSDENTLPRGARVGVSRAPRAAGAGALPLFSPRGEPAEDEPLITAPRPARPPLAVRRATPEPVRAKNRAARPKDDFELQLDTPPVNADPEAVAAPAALTESDTASALLRLFAAALDLLLLAAIDAAVIYFTLAVAGLPLDQIRRIPMIPMASFLVLLNGGYLMAFTAATGQTIGKMVAGIRVVRDDGRPVDVAGAALRLVGHALSLLTAGLGYLLAFMTADRRAVHDRIAGTRVVRARVLPER